MDMLPAHMNVFIKDKTKPKDRTRNRLEILQVTWSPYIYFSNCIPRGHACKYEGVLVDLMNQWSKKLNFTWNVHQDKDWGMVPKSGCIQVHIWLLDSVFAFQGSNIFMFYFPSVFLFLFSYILLFNCKYVNTIQLHLVKFISLFIFIDAIFTIIHPVLLFI